MRRRDTLFLILVGALHATAAGATVLAPIDLRDLSRDAGSIVRGRVVAAEARWTEGRRAIETLVTLDVDVALKGPAVSTIQWVVPGGTLGRYRSVVVGAPEFAIGQRVVVFLGWRPPAFPHLLGFGQGVFRIVAAADGSGPVIIPPPAVAPVGRVAAVVRGDAARRPLALADFEQRVRALSAGER